MPEGGFGEVEKALTYKIVPTNNKTTFKVGDRRISLVETVRSFTRVTPKILAIPQGRADLLPADCEIIDKRIHNKVPFPKALVPLNEHQQPIYDDISDSCIINALPGFGKTFTALHIAKKLGQKTLVIVHTLGLRDQWANECAKMFGHRPGIIGSGIADVEDQFIVIANIQTLNKVKDKYAKEFGTVIVDECLDYNSRIDTLEFGQVSIGKIVNQELKCSVWSMDPTTHRCSYKKVLRYFKNPHKEALKLTHSGGGNIRCTKNHGIYTYANGVVEKIPAEYLEVGDYLLESVKGHKANRILNQEWYPIILGLILGDGSIKLDNKASNSIRLAVTHGEAQFEYLDWKASILGESYVTEGASGFTPSRGIRTLVTKSFIDIDEWKRKIYGDTLSGSKKHVPADITKYLNIQSWALIYLDDGNSSTVSDTIVFSVCEIDLESCERLIDSLVVVFSLVERPVLFTCSKGYNYIRLNKANTLSFKSQVCTFIHPSMYYKLNRSINIDTLVFDFQLPSTPIFNESFCVRTIKAIESTTLTRGYRFNIEVEDNHTYFANNILVANCHHISAATFTDTLECFHARYRIGLSGTLVRTDGKHVLFENSFGQKVYKPPKSNTIDPKVQILKTGIMLTPGVPWVNKMNDLLYDDDYQQFIANLALQQIAKGHKVLVTASRVEFLEKVYEYIGKETCVLITGSSETKSQTVRDALLAEVSAGLKMCVVASRQIFTEGMSLNVLSCTILSEPSANKSNLEQLIGRIMRVAPDKLNPIVLDLHFAGADSRKKNNDRLGFYLEKGWEIEMI